MAQEMKKIGLFILTLALLGGVACSRNGTEVGSPGTSRTINGSLVTSNTHGLQAMKQKGPKESCPAENGDISVLLINPQGELISTSIPETGVFSLEILQSDRYEIQFAQGGETCGFLTYPNTEGLNGLRVTLGRGSLNIDLGDVRDLGKGIFVSGKYPSNFCDDDGDGFFDSDDFDDDGDGFFDSDEDFDGYLDWFDDDDDGDGIFDEDDFDDDEFGDSCGVIYVYPSEASGLFLDEDNMGEIEIYTNDDIASVNASEIEILDENENVVLSFTNNDVMIENDEDPVVILPVDLDPDTDYKLVIPAGAITCTSSDQNEEDIDIDFETFTDN